MPHNQTSQSFNIALCYYVVVYCVYTYINNIQNIYGLYVNNRNNYIKNYNKIANYMYI